MGLYNKLYGMIKLERQYNLGRSMHVFLEKMIPFQVSVYSVLVACFCEISTALVCGKLTRSDGPIEESLSRCSVAPPRTQRTLL